MARENATALESTASTRHFICTRHQASVIKWVKQVAHGDVPRICIRHATAISCRYFMDGTCMQQNVYMWGIRGINGRILSPFSNLTFLLTQLCTTCSGKLPAESARPAGVAPACLQVRRCSAKGSYDKA